MIESWIKYLHELHSSYQEELKSNSISKKTVHEYICHLPKRKINVGWPEEIYKASEQILNELFIYSKEMDFIPKEMNYDEFLNF